MDLIKALNEKQLQGEKLQVEVGDTVRVHVKVKEGSRDFLSLAYLSLVFTLVACNGILRDRPFRYLDEMGFARNTLIESFSR